MSRGFVKEGDQEELPVVPPRAFLPEGMINYVTPEGMQALLEEKETLISEKNELNSGKKRSYGNDSDKRVTTGYINAKLALLEGRIRSAVVVKAEERRGNVCVGAYVVMEMGKECLQRTVKITGTDEADSAKGLFLPTSGHAVGFIFGHLKHPEFFGVNPELLQHESMALLNA